VYIRLVFIDVVPKHLLTLFVHRINVVNHHDFLLPINRTMRLAERFHFVFEELNTLLFQVINKHDIRLGYIRVFRETVIFSQQGVQHGGFPGIRATNQENIQIVDFHERSQNKRGFIAFSRFIRIMGVVEIAQITRCVFFDKGFFFSRHGHGELHPIHLCRLFSDYK
jgi:hypothetical protein